MDTQAAIVEYQEMEDLSDREKLYNEKIHTAFEKLAESLISLNSLMSALAKFITASPTAILVEAL